MKDLNKRHLKEDLVVLFSFFEQPTDFKVDVSRTI